VLATADPLNVIADVVTPLQAATLLTVFTEGLGFTIILKDAGSPTHELAVGDTAIVAVSGMLLLFTALNEFILPLPLAARPMILKLFAHANVAPLTALVKLNAPVLKPLQTVKLLGTETLGVGLAVIVKDFDVPLQPLAIALTLKLATTGVVPVLLTLNEGIAPLPLPAKPMLLVLLIQL